MISRICKLFTSIPMTALSGVFLFLSLVRLPFFDLLAWVTVIISGLPLINSAIRKLIIKKGISKISSALLISIAMIASIIIGDLFAAGEVAFIMAIGEILEDVTTDRAKRGLKRLIELAPATARRIVNGAEERIPAESIKLGDIIRILPGETVTVDGIIISGETSIDGSVMTGESVPVDKGVGDGVFCGTLNCFGAIDVRATAVGKSTSLQRLIKTVKEAEEKKSPTERIADRWASVLVPVALLVAIIAGLATSDITRAVTVLVVFCPCALVLATPTAIMAAIGQATKRGVIIKSGEALEKMGKVNTVAFDKTGTLTEGKLHVCDAVSLADGIDSEMLLRLTASVEAKSEHPLGRAIAEHAEGLELLPTTDFKMQAGKGVSAVVGGTRVFCGSEAFLSENGIAVDGYAAEQINGLRRQGKALILVGIGGECIGVIALSDTLRKESVQTVNALRNMGVEAVLLTGDNRLTADFFAELVNIGTVKSELLPEDKVKSIKELQESGKAVCMIGDGVNDAPALKTADVGVAMGGVGSDIAVDSADIALMSDGISSLPYLKRLARATVNTIRFSISLSMLINILAVFLSVIGALTPTTGALVHNAGSVFVILIAALLYDRKF
ncbi:MAG: cation-translocating P-type ATPase [Clostridia bacterium]|nr:cation-translocating P-type ATPase [Clostridia bacterium]